MEHLKENVCCIVIITIVAIVCGMLTEDKAYVSFNFASPRALTSGFCKQK